MQAVFKLSINQEIIKEATYSSKGKKLVKRICKNCGLEDEKLVAIPRLGRSSFWYGESSLRSSGGAGSKW